MDKYLLVPKTVSWSKDKKEPLTYRDLLQAAERITTNEDLRVVAWNHQLREYAKHLDEQVRKTLKE